MRQILLAIALISASAFSLQSNMAAARSIDRTPVVAKLTGQAHGIKLIALLADGRLQIQEVDGNVSQAYLTKAAAKKLIDAAVNLTAAEIDVVELRTVCKAMAPPELADLEIADVDASAYMGFKGPTRQILSSSHCSTTKRVQPKHPALATKAIALRDQLLILALNLLP